MCIPEKLRHQLGSARRIVIDGPSGSGKTSLANALGSLLNVPVFHLDSWYPGWEGLEAGTRIAEELVTGQRTDYPAWNWSSHAVERYVPADLTRGWILEGCGALTAVTAAKADKTIWVEAQPETAKTRALTRDGESYAPWWDIWHMQETQHWTLHNPRSLADLIVNT